MIGVLVISHGAIGETLLASAEQILGGRQARVATLGVSRGEEPDALLDRARALAASVDAGAGVLVLTDMYGATPCNVAARLLADGRVEGVAGVSLPMLVRVLSRRNGSLPAAVQRALSGGAEGVVHMNTDSCGAQR
ncbi:MAG: PTS fructose transporter subunit IIA [Betaproteobacteria bacterium]|nr:PTS fructose transporter subunit IIA [Betaproteobacteria bacterium]MDH5220641.1 PTS fructose transporter subunit IIA [Betaproteobacteria bacterium]MDH5349330.1 PTS fructose transporter subunit IIA [Betaproteobacteria bacterium]